MRQWARIKIQKDAILIGNRLSISFHRTLRIPDDGHTYPLPPGLGRFPLRSAADYASGLPDEWREDCFLPIYAREALWIGFDGGEWKPNAVKIGAGGVNVVTGDEFDDRLRGEPQDYIVCPDQPWIDGINSHDGVVRQFVAMPFGGGYTIEAQVTGAERIGGLQFVVFEPNKGRFPGQPPAKEAIRGIAASFASPEPSLGLAVGGRMQQKIYFDRFGIETWDMNDRVRFRVHFVTSAEFSAITGEAIPATPVNAYAYSEAGLPWFELYEEENVALTPADALKRLRSIRDIEKREAEASIQIRRPQMSRVRKTK
jgi:hypothetical protein